MGLLDRWSGKQKRLEEVIFRLEANISNNYKDAAQANLKELEEAYAALVDEGKLSEKQRKRYSEAISAYRERMQKFTHKDQTPYWT